MSWHDYPKYRLPEQQEFVDNLMGFLWFAALVAGLAPAVIEQIGHLVDRAWSYTHMV